MPQIGFLPTDYPPIHRLCRKFQLFRWRVIRRFQLADELNAELGRAGRVTP